jgi:hypothetical protein
LKKFNSGGEQHVKKNASEKGDFREIDRDRGWRALEAMLIGLASILSQWKPCNDVDRELL